MSTPPPLLDTADAAPRRNRGPRSAARLRAAGPGRVGALRRLGRAAAFARLRITQRWPVSPNLPWAMAAGPQGRGRRDRAAAERAAPIAALPGRPG